MLSNGRTREFLQKRVVTAKEELGQAEKKLQQFQVDNKVYSTADQMKGLTDKITLIDREKAQKPIGFGNGASSV